MEHPIAFGRLAALVLMVVAILHLAIGAVGVCAARAWSAVRWSVAANRVPAPGWTEILWPYRVRVGLGYGNARLPGELSWFLLSWCALTALAWLLVARSLWIEKIRPAHVLRGAVYSVVPLLLVVPALALSRSARAIGGLEMTHLIVKSGGSGLRIDAWSNALRTLDRYLGLIDQRSWIVVIGSGLWLGIHWLSFARFYLHFRGGWLVIPLLVLVSGLGAFLLVASMPGGDLMQRIGTAIFGMQP